MRRKTKKTNKIYVCLSILIVVISFNHLVTIATAQQDLDLDDLKEALTSLGRTPSDLARDSIRKPIETLQFIGIEQGMTILDISAAGGYYTYILSKAVGPTGKILSQNTERGRAFVEDRQNQTQGEVLDNKITQAELLNVNQILGDLHTISIERESLDAALLMLTLHDLIYSSQATDLLRKLYGWLKPGGVIGISDHIGLPDQNNRALHRMEPTKAIELATEAGFTVESSDLLRNFDDNHARSIFDPKLARRTDRFLLRLKKP